MHRNIFVIGLDDVNLATLRDLPGADRYRFHQLLTVEELQHGDDIPFDDLLDEATRQLEEFDEQVDAVVGYWDFPVSSMVPILCARLGLRSASLEAVSGASTSTGAVWSSRRSSPSTRPSRSSSSELIRSRPTSGIRSG